MTGIRAQLPGEPARAEERGDIAVVRDIGERRETVRHPADAAVAVVLCDGRERGLCSPGQTTARRHASSPAVFGGLAHRGIEARDACGTLVAEGDADRRRRQVQRPGQRFTEPPPVRHITAAMSLSSCTRVLAAASHPSASSTSATLRPAASFVQQLVETAPYKRA